MYIIPLYEYTTDYFSIHLLMDIYIFSFDYYK